jgi:hypothetical protein
MPKKEELIALEKWLDSLKIGFNLLKKGIGYYVYFNKPTQKSRIFKIHHSSCGNCAWGTGKISKANPGKNGVWLGPFENPMQAKEFMIIELNIAQQNIENCNCC